MTLGCSDIESVIVSHFVREGQIAEHFICGTERLKN